MYILRVHTSSQKSIDLHFSTKRLAQENRAALQAPEDKAGFVYTLDGDRSFVKTKIEGFEIFEEPNDGNGSSGSSRRLSDATPKPKAEAVSKKATPQKHFGSYQGLARKKSGGTARKKAASKRSSGKKPSSKVKNAKRRR